MSGPSEGAPLRPRITAVAVAVVLDGDRVLVGTRAADTADAAGCDEFPGGKQRPGEDAAGAAARECLEETGLDVAVGEVLARVRSTAADGPIEITFLAAAPLGPPRPPRAPFRWVARAALRGLSFPAANAAVVACLVGAAAPAAHGGSSPPGCQG